MHGQQNIKTHKGVAGLGFEPRFSYKAYWAKRDIFFFGWKTCNTSRVFKMEVKVKVKYTLEQSTKDQRGSRCIALLFLWP